MYIDDLKKLIKEIEKAVQSNEKWITYEDYNLKNKLTRISEDPSHALKSKLKQTDKHNVNPYYYPNLDNQSNITQPIEQSNVSHSADSNNKSNITQPLEQSTVSQSTDSNNSTQSIVSNPMSQTNNSTAPSYSHNSGVVGNIKNFINKIK